MNGCSRSGVRPRGSLELTTPASRERRGPGRKFAVAPFLAVGKGLGPFSLQADVAYSWQVNVPRSIEPEEEGEARVRPDKTQSVTANLTATYSLIERLGLILELNSVTSARELDYNLIVILTKGF